MRAMEADVTRIVYTSSVSHLGLNHDGAPTSLKTVSGHYERTKFLAEQTVQQLIHKHNSLQLSSLTPLHQ